NTALLAEHRIGVVAGVALRTHPGALAGPRALCDGLLPLRLGRRGGDVTTGLGLGAPEDGVGLVQPRSQSVVDGLERGASLGAIPFLQRGVVLVAQAMDRPFVLD